MIEIRPFATLGAGHHGWLESRHHFSFADYYDPTRQNWGRLRVWNDDEIAPGTGFGAHPHRDMEIITYVRSGAITHKDNLGNEGRTVAGDVQIMSAGTGIVHSEFNLEDVTTTLFQIWIMPDQRGAKPGWGARQFPKAAREAHFALLASGRARDEESDALPLNANAALMAATLAPGQVLDHPIDQGRAVYLVPARGQVEVNGQLLAERDGAAIRDESSLHLRALTEEVELVLVDIIA